MEVVIVDVRREGEDRWIADLRLDESLGRIVLDFNPPGGDSASIDVQPGQLEVTRECKEAIWLIRRVRKGECLTVPHRVDVEDRWPSWPSVNEFSSEPLQRSRDIVLLKIEEEAPGVWAAEVLVDGLPERLVVQLAGVEGRYVLVRCSGRLRAAYEFVDVYRVLVDASEGRWPALPMQFARGLPSWLRDKGER